MIFVLNHRYMQSRIDTEAYAKNQLASKNSLLSQENLDLKNKMLISNNDVDTHAKRNSKRVLRDILDSYVDKNQLKYYEIITTSTLATKHPLFEYARTFDFIIISDVGLINVDVKNWKQKTFYHFDASTSDELNIEDFQSVDQVIGHYVAKQYHSQFNSTRNEVYTFIEKIHNNRVIYDFYENDPYQHASQNAKYLKDQIENHFNHKIQSIGVVYFNDGSVNIIEGSEEREKYVDTVSTQSSLNQVIGQAIELCKHPLTQEQVEVIANNFK